MGPVLLEREEVWTGMNNGPETGNTRLFRSRLLELGM